MHKEDDEYIEKNILKGPFDGHAGNSEISNMLVIDEVLVKMPAQDYPKFKIINLFKTDNLIEKCPNVIADNHPQWNINIKNGKIILDIHIKRIIKNLEKHLQD